MVREGYIAKDLPVVVAVKSAPSAIAVLHAEQPLNSRRIADSMRFSSGNFTRCNAIKTNAVSSTSDKSHCGTQTPSRPARRPCS